ncbi:MAG: hypothetical protein IKX96_05130 [Firmicutes bacterium]|nr:hypothetical protein [Bacillota bacterium]
MYNTLYTLTSKDLHLEETVVRSYGIACLIDNALQQRIDDISTDRHIVEYGICRFNEYALSPEHFADAVDDLLP